MVEHGDAERAVNAGLRSAIEPLPQARNHSLQFFCECGCGDIVFLTVAEYDALDGKAVCRPGHPSTAATA